LWMGGSGEGELKLWEVKVEKGAGVWVGLTTPEHFGEGYSLRGLMYGGPGNLGDGNQLLVGGWGPKLEEGDNLLLSLELAGPDKSLISITRNGQNLGLAFNLSGWAGAGAFIPVVSLSSGQEVSIRDVKGPGLHGAGPCPTNRDIDMEISGAWEGEGIKVRVDKVGQGETYMLSLKLANMITCTVEKHGQDGSLVLQGEVIMTKLMASPEVAKKEQEIVDLLQGIKFIKRNRDNLIITGNSGSLELEKASPKEPVTLQQLPWLLKEEA